MVQRHSEENYNGSEAWEIIVVCIEAILENHKEIPLQKIYKNCLYSSGITEISLTKVTPQPLSLSA